MARQTRCLFPKFRSRTSYEKGCRCEICTADRQFTNWLQRERVREKILESYGRKCSCCGETIKTFLCLDHIKNDGYLESFAHRSGPRLYRKVLRENCPKDRYQLLCYNCNIGKSINKGICPHQEISQKGKSK